ncbi:hypothetical protein [Arthrospiribacter ruber]|uniref:Uncharacterized protein n=1 Tax=Arthrospiribacter ruber TaxID=2487934 RepID=A0A951IR61_9BACT|nr:hypothetical protein [Arthrospiribacter ruber]MBW3466580.1 hypothetical protein [Arthrospiribacter ruber]
MIGKGELLVETLKGPVETQTGAVASVILTKEESPTFFIKRLPERIRAGFRFTTIDRNVRHSDEGRVSQSRRDPSSPQAPIPLT